MTKNKSCVSLVDLKLAPVSLELGVFFPAKVRTFPLLLWRKRDKLAIKAVVRCRQHSMAFNNRGGKTFRGEDDTNETSQLYGIGTYSWHPISGSDLGSHFRCHP